MLNILRKSAFVMLSVGTLTFGITAHAGSTIGGNPANGGGTQFGAPLTGETALGAALVITADDGGALEAAVASGDAEEISRTLGEALRGSGIVLTNTQTGQSITVTAATDLEPLPGQTGAASVAFLRELVLDLAEVLGLTEDADVIQTLLSIADTAIE